MDSDSRSPLTAIVTKTLLLMSVVLAADAASGSADGGRPPAVPREVATAFARLLPSTASPVVQRRYLQADDRALTDALQKAEQSLVGGFSLGPDRISVSVESVAQPTPDAASVAFTVTVHGRPSGSFRERFSGSAVLVSGRWKVSWATACFLVEFYDGRCPPTPAGIVSPLPLPTAVEQTAPAHARVAGLMRPSELAVARNGSLLIVDTWRDQILRRLPDGKLEVVAGTGEQGFAGDGGPAVDAELDRPEGLAVAKDGTIDVADSGNNRVRAIAPDGTITTLAGNGHPGDTGDGDPATRAEIRAPSGLAIAADGALYVATAGAGIRVVSPAGTITTFFKGGPPYGEVRVGAVGYAFEPQWLAFNGAGDLDVFSFSPKEIFEFAPDGAPLKAWPDYADGLATLPDGTVVVAQHGAGLARLTAKGPREIVNLTRAKIPGFGSPGLPGAFEPEGIAAASNGLIYIDTWVGDGWTLQTAVAEVTTAGHATLVGTTTPLLGTLPRLAAPGYPAALYPLPTPARSGAELTACPAPTGIRPFDPSARRRAIAAAKRLDSGFWISLQLSDRAWWPGIYADQTSNNYDPGAHTIISVEPATHDLYSRAVSQGCGTRLLQDSLAIVVGPSGYSSQASHLYFLDRDGHSLLYWQYT